MTVTDSSTSHGVIGQRILRREDAKLLTGEAKFSDDLSIPGALHMAVLRSTIAHGKITSVNVEAAKAAPGVVGVYTYEDLKGDWAGPMPCAWPVTAEMKNPPHYPLANGKVNYVGDGIAVVLANSKEAAVDALEAIEVDYEELNPVLELEDSLSDARVIHGDLGTNTSYVWELIPDKPSVDAAFANAVFHVSERYVQQRLIPAAMEPRSVAVIPAPFGGDFTFYSSTQVPHILKIMLALTVGVSETKLRVVAPAVGGGFGSKLNVYAEEVLALALARKLSAFRSVRSQRSAEGAEAPFGLAVPSSRDPSTAPGAGPAGAAPLRTPCRSLLPCKLERIPRVSHT